MRCERAQESLAARIDGELSPWRTRRLDRHLARCATCSAEVESTTNLFAALDDMVRVAPVPDHLERDTLRAVQALATESSSRRGVRRWFEVAVPMLSAAAVLMLTIRLTTSDGGSAPRVHSALGAAAGRPPRRGGSRHTPPPVDAPPAALAAAPELFIELPILRRLEKLQHFDAIRASRPPAGPASEPAASNG